MHGVSKLLVLRVQKRSGPRPTFDDLLLTCRLRRSPVSNTTDQVSKPVWLHRCVSTRYEALKSIFVTICYARQVVHQLIPRIVLGRNLILTKKHPCREKTLGFALSIGNEKSGAPCPMLAKDHTIPAAFIKGRKECAHRLAIAIPFPFVDVGTRPHESYNPLFIKN